MGANLATALLTHGRIQTTLPKARLAREVAERAITLGKDGSLHARRQAISLLRNKEVTYSLFDRIAPAFRDVNGGYTRTLKLGPRAGDAAEMVLLELTRDLDAAPAAEAEAPPRRRRRRGRGGDEAGAAAAPATVEVAEDEDEPEVVEDAGEAPEDEPQVDDAPAAEADDDSSDDDSSDDDSSDDDDSDDDESAADEDEAGEPVDDGEESADAEEDRARE
jgi:large subunit ribosomal protein L17